MTVIVGTTCAPGEDADEEDSVDGFFGDLFNPFMSGLGLPASFGEIKYFDDKIMTPQHRHSIASADVAALYLEIMSCDRDILLSDSV